MSVRVPFLRPRHFFWAPSKKAQPVRRLYSRTDEHHRPVGAAKKRRGASCQLGDKLENRAICASHAKKMGQKPVIDIAFETSSN